MDETLRWRVQIGGRVQGVGFRPQVLRLAESDGLCGWVCNDGDGLSIEAEGPRASLEHFAEALRKQAPPQALIERLEITTIAATDATAGFTIRPSLARRRQTPTPLTDIAMCASCRAELLDPRNRRHRYPFIACSDCGPRWSALHAWPYDRANTAMAMFPPCAGCTAEYADPHDRRFHAQNTACADCGPQLAWWDGDGRVLAQRDAALRHAVQALRDGAIVAVKGLGGFHLMADAGNLDAILKLRARKQRPHKPLALMLDGMAEVQGYCVSTADERALLSSPAAPIVLLRSRGGLPSALAPGNPCLGVMLPYTPLHQLLLRDLGRPLVATSGNRGGEPLCADEREALQRLAGIADGFLVHDRPILNPVDDSVVQFAAGRPLLLRAARGYAPLRLPGSGGAGGWLAAGGQLKASIALASDDALLVGAHIGDLGSRAADDAYQRSLDRLPALLGATVSKLVVDRHPDYRSTRLANARYGAAQTVQHHHAHIAAVMAEHGLDEPVLGLAWDGSGLGDDGTLWGGEALLASRSSYTRIASLRPFALPGGEQALREPRRAALGLLHAIGVNDARLAAQFTAADHANLQRILDAGFNCPRCSSVGRLFDAAAALLGLADAVSFEGQAAMALQFAAERHRGSTTALPCSIDRQQTPWRIDWAPAIRALLTRRGDGEPVESLAAAFHAMLVDVGVQLADACAPRPLVLAGGCFQNRLLLETLIAALRAAGHRVWWPHRLPPNDGALALGQLAVAQARAMTQEEALRCV